MNPRWSKHSPDAVFVGAACAGSILVNEGCCSNTDVRERGVFDDAGPIYIHETHCQPESEILTAYPDDFRELPLLLRAYTAEDNQLDSKLINDSNAETIIDIFCADPKVAYIHLRDGESGCYYARILRAES